MEDVNFNFSNRNRESLDDVRNDAAMRQSSQRAQTPKLRPQQATAVSRQRPLVVVVSDEQSHRPENDVCDWTHVGTSPYVTEYNMCNRRRMCQRFMGDM
jgi:hypothetical protein